MDFQLIFPIAMGLMPDLNENNDQKPEDMIELEEMITEQAKLCFNALKRLYNTPPCNDYFSFRMTYFGQRFMYYCTFINHWQNIRRDAIIEMYIQVYWEKKIRYNRLIAKSPEDQAQFKDEISSLEGLLKEIESKLDDLHARDQIEKHAPIVLDLDKFEEIFHKAFWDQLEEDLGGDKPNNLRLVDLLNDLKALIKSCYPSRVDKHMEIDRYLDSDLLKQMIVHQAIDGNEVYKMVMYILDRIKEVQRPVDDKDWDIWKEDLETKFNIFKNLDNVEDVMEFWKVFFPEFFRKAFKWVENIFKEIQEFKKTSEYQALKEAKEQSLKQENK